MRARRTAIALVATLATVGAWAQDDDGFEPDDSVDAPAAALVLSGTVVGPEGEPLPHAVVAAMGRQDDHVVPVTRVDAVHTDKKGAFTLRGEHPPGDVEVGVHCAGHVLDRRLAWPRGTRGVTVRLAAGGGIAGTVIPFEQPGRQRVLVELVGDPVDTFASRVRGPVPRLVVDVLGGGGFGADTLRAGKLDVTLRREGDRRPLLVVRDVVVQAGRRTRDPRLQRIDLDALLPLREVTVHGADGRPAVGARVYHRPADTRTGWNVARVAADGIARLRCHGATAELIVQHERHVAHERDLSGTRATIALTASPGARVTIALAAGSARPPPPYRLVPDLAYLGGPDSTTTRPEAFADPRGLGSIAPAQGAIVAETTLWTPGRYRVGITVWSVRGGVGRGGVAVTRPVHPVLVVPAEGGPVRLEVFLTEDAIRAAIGPARDR